MTMGTVSGSTRLCYELGNGLRCPKRPIEMFEILDWNPNTGLKWRALKRLAMRHKLPAHRAISGHYHLYYHCGESDKKCRLARLRLSVLILVNTYRCLWLGRQKLLKSCGGTFQTCRYKIICICSCLVNSHCLTEISTIKAMQQMGYIGCWQVWMLNFTILAQRRQTELGLFELR